MVRPECTREVTSRRDRRMLGGYRLEPDLFGFNCPRDITTAPLRLLQRAPASGAAVHRLRALQRMMEPP
jgi:hypothetical protein